MKQTMNSSTSTMAAAGEVGLTSGTLRAMA